MSKYHESISKYLDSQLRTYLTDEFAYASYTSPNTTFSVHNDLFEIMLGLNPSALKMYLRTVTLLKRNADPVLACTIKVKYELYEDLFSPRSFKSAKKELITKDLFLTTDHRDIVIVNVKYANKLFKPKVEEFE